MFKRFTRTMRWIDAVNLCLLAVFYTFIESKVEELRWLGFFGFLSIFAFYLINVLFRNAIEAWVSLRQDRIRKEQIELKVALLKEAQRIAAEKLAAEREDRRFRGRERRRYRLNK